MTVEPVVTDSQFHLNLQNFTQTVTHRTYARFRTASEVPEVSDPDRWKESKERRMGAR